MGREEWFTNDPNQSRDAKSVQLLVSLKMPKYNNQSGARGQQDAICSQCLLVCVCVWDRYLKARRDGHQATFRRKRLCELREQERGNGRENAQAESSYPRQGEKRSTKQKRRTKSVVELQRRKNVVWVVGCGWE